MIRPVHLPDYKSPPINEVALGIQFTPVVGYQQIYAREVWALFEKHFPEVEEHQPLPSTFETFGLPQKARMGFGLTTGASHDRFWFLSEKKEQLIQFQSDKFLHNWRKVSDNPYPHFEEIIESYEKELKTLEQYFSKFSSESLKLNQCELTYINHIPLMNNSSNEIDRWLKIVTLEEPNLEDFSFAYRKVLKDTDDKSYGRLICEGYTGINKNNEAVIVLNITVRGMPQEPTISSALDFLKSGREMIVSYFDQITTDFAHKQWGKK